MIASRNARRTRHPAAITRGGNRAFPAYFAWFLLVLQVATALHFALVPHAFGTGLVSFVHVEQHVRAEGARLVRPRTPARAREAVQGYASCAADSCPIGFAGHGALELARFELSVALPEPSPSEPPVLHSNGRLRANVLASAPKTSPPA